MQHLKHRQSNLELLTLPVTEKVPSKDFLTISDTSLETVDEKSSFESLSAFETLSLEYLDGQTINPDSYSTLDEEANAKPEWLVIGQPDSLLSDTTNTPDEDTLLESVITPAESVDLDFDKQKRFADTHMERRLKAIKRYLEDMELCDLSLQFGTSTTPVHALMLGMQEGFVSRFPGLTAVPKKPTTKTRQLDVYGDVTVPAFQAVMNFVYAGQCQVAYENLAEVVTAVEFFGITVLDEEITKMVEQVMTDTNLLPIVFQGDSDHPLHEIAWTKLLERITVIAKQGDYIALEIGEICKILAADGLAVQTEYQVFELALNWIRADRFTRTVHFNKIISCVRFHFMTAAELSRCQREEELLTTSKPIADIVALAYIARPFILENDLTFLESFELLPPRNLDVLRHFTAYNEKQISPVSEREDSYPEQIAPVRHEWGLKPSPRPTAVVHLDNATLDGLGDLPEDKLQPPVEEDTKNRTESTTQSVLSVRKSSVTKKRATSSRSVGSGNGSGDASPSFSDMTFNDNGSLVTKRGGKEVHRTLNRAFERIYSEKLGSSLPNRKN